jgi:asparagine synthase (glutamine-hydrolysing)
MCGIALVLHRDSAKAETVCRRAIAAISHRGSDNEGFQSIVTRFGTIVLGHRRLSILDLTPTGAQPMVDPQTGNTIIFTGEICNFQALKSELETQGVPSCQLTKKRDAPID